MEVLFSSGRPELEPALCQRLQRLGRRVLEAHPLPGPVQLILTHDEEIRQLNAEYRHQDAATDVLSFSYADADPLPQELEGACALGEVYISLDRAAAQAQEQAVPLPEELGRLLVHGLLHLAGYEHDTETELALMEQLTESLLQAATP